MFLFFYSVPGVAPSPQFSMRYGPKMAQKLLRPPAFRLLHEAIEAFRSLPPRGV